ncbi:MAG: hypothetical protein J5714_02460 [Alphaproteobacteria bacterium]|nr:hypothetical protein [Alphaproteobacteria bacterium]
MKLFRFLLILLCVWISIPGAAYDDFDEFEAAEFEGAFEACFEMQELLDDDPQCLCIYRVARETLSDEDFGRAVQLLESGRNGSARHILKQALKPAMDNCF